MPKSKTLELLCETCGTEQCNKSAPSDVTRSDGTCDYCGEENVALTSVRDFGGLKAKEYIELVSLI